jgi:hypothetical protein
MPAFVTPNKHTPWNFQTFSFVNSCYTLYNGYALTWCGLTFVTSLNVVIKHLYSDSDMHGVLVAWWQQKCMKETPVPVELSSTRQTSMKHWWNNENNLHRSIQDGYYKKPARQSPVHTSTKLLCSKLHTFTVVKNPRKQTLLQGYIFVTGSVTQCIVMTSVHH